MGLTEYCFLWLFFSGVGVAISIQETLRWKLSPKGFVMLLVVSALVSTGTVWGIANYQGMPVSFNR